MIMMAGYGNGNGGDISSINSSAKAVKVSNFSIDYILKRAGNGVQHQKMVAALPWLQCTRYCPPKLQRSSKRDGPQKRRLGRHPRIPFSSEQLAILEDKYKQTPYLSTTEVKELSAVLDLAEARVKVWFQNRRARERKEALKSYRETKPEPAKSDNHIVSFDEEHRMKKDDNLRTVWSVASFAVPSQGPSDQN